MENKIGYSTSSSVYKRTTNTKIDSSFEEFALAA